MAKLSANGEEIARYEKNNTRYSFRTNGKILVCYCICGKWEGWKHSVAAEKNPQYVWMGILEREGYAKVA